MRRRAFRRVQIQLNRECNNNAQYYKFGQIRTHFFKREFRVTEGSFRAVLKHGCPPRQFIERPLHVSKLLDDLIKSVDVAGFHAVNPTWSSKEDGEGTKTDW